MSDPVVHIVSDTGPALARVAADRLIAAINAAIAKGGRARLGLSGGSTPGPILRHLARELPAEVYPRLRVTWVDERHLPLVGAGGDWRDYPAESNLRLAYEAWLGGSPAPDVVLPLSTGRDLDEDLARFDAAFQRGFDGGLDVVLLGAGPDGHIASLFPGHEGLDAQGACLAIRDSPKPPPQRISLSLPVLEAAGAVILVARGVSKAAMLARAHARDEALPLGRLTPRGAYEWVLDRGAASAL